VSGHAIVIGSSSGIGAAVARKLSTAGYDVTGVARRETPGVRSIRGDVAKDLAGPLDEAIAAAGVPAVVVYAAGVPVMGQTTAVPYAMARSSFEVNFWGLDAAVRHLLPRMSEAKKGSIVAVLSLAALRAVPHETYYAAAKAACARYLECVAHEAARDGIRVDYICPGYIETGFLERGGWHGMEVPTVKGSGVSPDDVAAAVLELAEGKRRGRVLGWRERVITLADRVAPGLYDRWLARS
jgi:short-subunit dehydrogenase